MKFVTALLAWMPLAQACISDLNEIVQIEEELTDDTELRVYKLCPHTTYDLADSFEPDGTARNGQHPLLMGRSNILVQCGDDGKSEDDCVLRGGLFQLGFLDEFETGRPVENATIRGITFQQALSMNVLIQHTGDLTIEDCIFRGNRNVANVLLDAPTTPVRRRDLGSQEVLEDVARRTETANLDNMNLVITKSLFQNNNVFPYAGNWVDGLVTLRAPKSHVEISECMFLGTKVATQDRVMLPYHILVQNGNVAIRDNCFVDMDERINHVLHDGGTLSAKDNFVERQTENGMVTECEFIAEVVAGSISLRSPFEDMSYSCIDSDADICSAPSKVEIPCVESLDSLYFLEETVKDESVKRTYMLCPRQTYKVAAQLSLSNPPADGSHPITIGRPNMRVLCGTQGKVEDECVLSGGDVQLKMFDEFASGDLTGNNIVVRGLTFTQAHSVNVLLSTPGSFVLSNCLFKNNSNLATIYIQGSTRPINGADAYTSTGLSVTPRIDLQPGSGGLTATIENSVFEENTIGRIPGRSSGLITSYNATLEIRGNNFFDNGEHEGISESHLTYLIGNYGGSLSLKKNCFHNNDVSMAPVLTQTSNFKAVNNDGDVQEVAGCDFLASFPDIEAKAEEEIAVDFTCVDFDGDVCKDFVEPIVLKPVAAPSANPQEPMSVASGTTAMITSTALLASAFLLFQ